MHQTRSVRQGGANELHISGKPTRLQLVQGRPSRTFHQAHAATHLEAGVHRHLPHLKLSALVCRREGGEAHCFQNEQQHSFSTEGMCLNANRQAAIMQPSWTAMPQTPTLPHCRPSHHSQDSVRDR